MAKFHGIIGYVTTKETSPGVWQDIVNEIVCRGDIFLNKESSYLGDTINPKFNISHRFSIISNGVIENYIEKIRYVEYKEIKWNVSNIEIRRPRLILYVNGVYND